MENARASRLLHVLPVPCPAACCTSLGLWTGIVESGETPPIGASFGERIFSRGKLAVFQNIYFWTSLRNN